MSGLSGHYYLNLNLLVTVLKKIKIMILQWTNNFNSTIILMISMIIVIAAMSSIHVQCTYIRL